MPFFTRNVNLDNYFMTDTSLVDKFMASQLWTFGNNQSGELGDNQSNYNYGGGSPIQTVMNNQAWFTVAGGYAHSGAILSDNTLWVWGSNGSGELGDNTVAAKSSPIQTVTKTSDWSMVAMGNGFTAAIKTDGSLWTWGGNSYGQLGDNTTVSKSSPVQTIARGYNWRYVACGYFHVAAIKTDGTLWLWGRNTTLGDGNPGYLGDNSGTNKSSPVQTVAGGTDWASVAGGKNHTIALKQNGTVWAWGTNVFYGMLGDNTTVSKSSPVQVLGGTSNWSQIAAGFRWSGAIDKNGRLWTWGENGNGSLGDNTTTRRSSPVQTVAGGTDWKFIAFGKMSAGIKFDGTLYVWGQNYGGSAGTNSGTANYSSPVQVVLVPNGWKTIGICQGAHTVGLRYNG